MAYWIGPHATTGANTAVKFGISGIKLRILSMDFFFFQAEEGLRDTSVTGVQTCALPISDPDGAYAHYSRAFALNPGEAEAQIGLGRLLTTMDKFQEAAKYLRMAVQSDPLNGEAHYRLASVSRTLELKDEAAKEFRLFQEIKQTKKDLKELYRQMNKKPPEQEEQIPDAEP